MCSSLPRLRSASQKRGRPASFSSPANLFFTTSRNSAVRFSCRGDRFPVVVHKALLFRQFLSRLRQVDAIFRLGHEFTSGCGCGALYFRSCNPVVPGGYGFLQVLANACEYGSAVLVPTQLIFAIFEDSLACWNLDLLVSASSSAGWSHCQTAPSNIEKTIAQKGDFNIRHE